MHELHQPRRNDEKCHSFKTLLSVSPLSPLWQTPALGWAETERWLDQCQPPAQLLHLPIASQLCKNPPLQSSLQYIVSKKPHSADEMSSLIPLSALLQQGPANEKCLCNHTFLCKQHLYTSAFFFFLLSPSPSLTAIRGKRWQQDNCWEFLLLYVHKTPL